MKAQIELYIEHLSKTWEKVDLNSLLASLEFLKEQIGSELNIFIAGNGGSSSTASHFVTDWSKGINTRERIRSNISCLSDNTPLITAIANDMDYTNIFAYQLEMFAIKGDVLVAISGSGNSQNIIEAALMARKLEMKIVALTGFDGGKLKELADYNFHCPIEDMQIVEDMHLSFGHMIVKC